MLIGVIKIGKTIIIIIRKLCKTKITKLITYFRALARINTNSVKRTNYQLRDIKSNALFGAD